MHEGFLVYHRFRYLKAALLLSVAAIAGYSFYVPIDMHNGGTWLGYCLGCIGFLIILWLMWFGIRKRRYGGHFNLKAWLSAHVYLGLSLIVVATLHTGFQFGWNVHTLAYMLMMLVIASGGFGIYAYARYPALMTENRRGKSFDEIIAQIGDIDRECRQVSAAMPLIFTEHVVRSCTETVIGGNCWRQLSGNAPKCASVAAFEALRKMSTQVPAEHSGEFRKLLTLMGTKCGLLETVRRDIQMKAMLDIWLYFHVPMSFALLAALLVHIVSVFYYW